VAVLLEIQCLLGCHLVSLKLFQGIMPVIVLNALVYMLLNRDIIQRIMGSEISLGMSLLACMLLEHRLF
jgi:hypothetical protein